MAPSFFSSVLPQTEATDRFITAQQVREIRAQLRRMSEQNSIDAIKDSSHQRVDTEQRRVPGTLVISDDLDEKFANLSHLERFQTAQFQNLKKAVDGKTILVPQPSDDPEDPLNWSWGKKHRILFVIAFCAIIPDMSSVWGVPLIMTQSLYWPTSTYNVGRSLSGNMLGVGGLVSVPFTQRFGRIPVLWWTMFLSLWMALFATLAPNNIAFIVARCLQGLFTTAPQVIGLSFIHDMFFFHEHARKIGIWASAFVISPYLGSFLAAIISNYKSWRTAFWVDFVIIGLALVFVTFLGDETMYDRDAIDKQPSKPKGWFNYRVKILTGIYGFRCRGRTTVSHSTKDLFFLLTRPYFLCLCAFYMLTFMWAVGIRQSLVLFLYSPPEAGGYGFSGLAAALFYIAPMTAVICGEIFGHFFNDYLANSYIKRHHGVFEPETRLWTIWISDACMVGGLVFLGFALHDLIPWIRTAIAWAIYVFGTLTATVAIEAYSLDIFPEQAAEAAAWINMSRSVAGFIVNYFQLQWLQSVGAKASFGTQAAIIFAAFWLVVAVQVFGRRWRERFPPPHPCKRY